MNVDDDADEDEKGMSAAGYPCMPSLVALQQMKNRLHLAYLGKKLMKWTAQATVRELRRIAQDINMQYKDFKDEIGDAFILLARSRYYKPILNKIVLENVPKKACLHINITTRSVSGVKLIVLEAVESGEEPYACLGLEKGGQTITETKKAWRELLIKMVHITELRKGFYDVDIANKTATKRMTLMKRVLIPKIKATIEYILYGLEEIAREDKYRLKMIKDHKRRVAEKSFEEKKKAMKAAEESKVDDTLSPVESERVPSIPSQVISPVKVASPVEIPSSFLSLPTSSSVIKVPPYKVISWNEENISIESVPKPEPVPPHPFGLPAVCDQCEAMKATLDQTSDMKIAVLKERLNDIIAQSKVFMEKGVKNVNVGQFLKACESVKSQIEGFFKTNAAEKGIDQNFKVKLIKLKNNLHEVIGLTKEEFEKCTQTCDDMKTEKGLETKGELSVINLDNLDEPPVTQGTKSKLVNLKNEIDDVVKMTASLQKNGLLAPSVDKFLTTCSSVRSKIDEYTHTTDDTSLDKLEHLSRHVSSLKEMAADIQLDDLTSCVIEKFLASLKEFQLKLDEYKKRQRNSPHEGLQKLVTQLDGAIELTKEAKESGLLSESVENFISQCERMKHKLSKSPKKIDRYIDDYDINDTMNKLLKYLSGGTLTESTENIVKYLEQKAINENIASSNSRGEIIYPGCSFTCICSNKNLSPDGCSLSAKSSKNNKTDKSPCISCQKTMSCTKTDSKNIFNKNSEKVEKEISSHTSVSWFDYEGSKVLPDTRSYKDDCNERPKGPVYRKIKQITKITRIQGADGTVSEETETITIKKEVDSIDSSLNYNEEYELSNDTLKDNTVNKEVEVCVTPDFAQRGFLRHTRSECCFRAVPLCNTGFWPCTSVENIRFLND